MSNENDELYDVEEIRGRKWDNNFQDYRYLIKWKNYCEYENSWEVAATMYCDDLIEEFFERCKKVFGKDIRNSKRRIVFNSEGLLIEPRNVSKKKKKYKVLRKISSDENSEDMPTTSATLTKDLETVAALTSVSRASKFTSFEPFSYVNRPWELEEEEEPGFVYNLHEHGFKIIDDSEDSGFNRKWEVERIVVMAVIKRTDGSKYECAVVKFKKYKYAQRIGLAKVLKFAKPELHRLISEEIVRVNIL